MSTVAPVPDRPALTGNDALESLRRAGWVELARASFERFRRADGFSHSRALGFQITLTAIPAVIASIGLATVLDQPALRRVIQQTLLRLAPGPTDTLLRRAFEQGAGKGGASALWLGLAAAAVSGTVAMALVERGANRIYGEDEDRGSVRRYLVAFTLAGTAGVLLLGGFVAFILGRAIGEAGRGAGWDESFVTAWRIARWPVGLAFVIVAFALLFKRAPRRRQPDASWLVFGSGLAVALWTLFTSALALYLTLSSRFGQTYGFLSGLIGILLWAYLSSLALFLGLAFSAQLEAGARGGGRSL
jgi:YihY family inner membrane protein